LAPLSMPQAPLPQVARNGPASKNLELLGPLMNQRHHIRLEILRPERQMIGWAWLTERAPRGTYSDFPNCPARGSRPKRARSQTRA
jgi:hypothetical protein